MVSSPSTGSPDRLRQENNVLHRRLMEAEHTIAALHKRLAGEHQEKDEDIQIFERMHEQRQAGESLSMFRRSLLRLREEPRVVKAICGTTLVAATFLTYSKWMCLVLKALMQRLRDSSLKHSETKFSRCVLI